MTTKSDKDKIKCLVYESFNGTLTCDFFLLTPPLSFSLLFTEMQTREVQKMRDGETAR